MFVAPDDQVLKGKHFADVEEVKPRNGGSINGIAIDKFKNCLEKASSWLCCVREHSEGA